MITVLKNENLEIGISDFGAELQYIRSSDGTEYLWDAGDDALRLRAPVLFPFVSYLPEHSFVYRGKIYQTPFTGFAHGMTFILAECSDTEAEYVLDSSEETKKMYPFDFRLKMKYELHEHSLRTEISVENTGEETMYFSLGWHPTFRIPMESDTIFDDYIISFAEKCRPSKIVRDKGFDSGLREPVALTNDQILELNDSMFGNEPVKVLTDISRTVTLSSSEGWHGVTVSFPGMKHLVLFHKPGVPFITIEAWTSLMAEKNRDYNLENTADLIRLKAGECHFNRWETEIF